MFDKSSEACITFQLTAKNRDLIVDHALAVDHALTRKLGLGVVEGKKLTFTFQLQEFMALVDGLASEAGRASSRYLRRRFSRIYTDLARRLDAVSAPPVDLDGSHSDFHRKVQEVLESELFDNVDDVNKRLQQLSEEFNRQPLPDFDGLSPSQVDRLIHSDWEEEGAAVVLNRGLSLPALEKSEILTNARVFLHALLQCRETKATAAGNLNRKFVRQMVEAMSWPPGYVDDLKTFRKVWNEEDVFLLHVLKIVLAIGGLVRKFKGSFRITKKGERLAQKTAAGDLYALLFQTFFRKFNLAYLDRCVECPGVQQTIAYSLVMVGRHATNWVSPKQLAQKLILHTVSVEIPPSPFGTDDQALISETRILRPLTRFGLVEWQHLEDRALFRLPIGPVRKTALFDDFLSFHLGGY